MSKKGWIIFVALAVAVLGGLVLLSNQQKLDVSGFDANAIIGANDKNGNIGDRVLGDKNSKVVFIEYGDYQCPGCGSAYPRIKEVTERYQGQIAFVFRNLPLTAIHPNARAAAASAEAAGQPGKFWEMHDKIFANQDAWKNASTSERVTIFQQYAKDLGLDIAKFDSDVASTIVNQKILFDQAIFKSTGHPQSTPTFMLNGELVSQEIWGADEALDTFIKEKITAAGIKLPDTPKE